ncbi:hypothetical protein [Rufibacter immobilis]|uniref:hypothetical protein n=1 Tax=Rufibacter immobilis TaxID=1348778 RepID=UPI0035EFECFB
MEQIKLITQYPHIPGLHNQGDVFLALPEIFMFQKNGRELIVEISQVLDEGLVAVNLITTVDDYQNGVVSYFSSAEPMVVNELTVLLIYTDVNSHLLRPMTVQVKINEDGQHTKSQKDVPNHYVLLFKEWNETSN